MRHEESQIQSQCVKWFRLQHRDLNNLLFSVPNGAAVKSEMQAIILKREGLLSGVSDLILLVPNKQSGALCIEMKTAKGKQSDSQKEFQEAVESRGYQYSVCRSLDDFIKVVTDYLAA